MLVRLVNKMLVWLVNKEGGYKSGNPAEDCK